GAIDAGHVRRPVDVADPAAERGLRATEHQAVVDAADRQRIVLAAEVQRAAATGAADDPAAFVDRQRDGAALGLGRREACEQDNRRGESASEYGRKSHGVVLLQPWG